MPHIPFLIDWGHRIDYIPANIKCRHICAGQHYAHVLMERTKAFICVMRGAIVAKKGTPRRWKVRHDWKIARVATVYKEGLTNVDSSDRPILVLPVVLCLFEKPVSDQFYSFFTEHHPLFLKQSGVKLPPIIPQDFLKVCLKSRKFLKSIPVNLEKLKNFTHKYSIQTCLPNHLESRFLEISEISSTFFLFPFSEGR